MVDVALRASVDVMDSGALWIVLLLSPLLTLVHELGHAAVGLACSEGVVVVRVGRAPGLVRGRIGRLAFELNPIPGRGAAGSAQTYARLDGGAWIACALAGPLADLLLAALLFPACLAAQGRTQQVLGVMIGYSVTMAVYNLVPFSRLGFTSDGYHLREALRSSRERAHPAWSGGSVDTFVREFDDTAARWLAMLSDARHPCRTPRLARLLAGAPAALDVDDEACEGYATALQLAFAGWCWRDVERGEPARLGSTVRDASRRAAQTGAVGTDAISLAARELASSDLLGSASPGADETERAGFLSRAAERITSSLGAAGLTTDQGRFAFLYGVALRDLERAAA
jgi:hypothetical protein